MKTRYLVVTHPAAPLQARAAKLGWTEEESLWDYFDPAEGEEEKVFKSSQLAFLAARKAAPLDVWGAVQIREQVTDKEHPREDDWKHVSTWEVTKGQRLLGQPTFIESE